MAKPSRDVNTIDSLLLEYEPCLYSIRVHPISTGHHVLSLASLQQVESSYSTVALESFAWCPECIYSCTLPYTVLHDVLSQSASFTWTPT